MDGTAGGAADAEDSAADGLHSRGQRYGVADGAAGAEDSAAGGLHSEDQGTVQRVVLRMQRAVRRTACTARTKDGAADSAVGAEDSAADGLHGKDKGRRSERCCGSRGQCGGRPAQQGQRAVRQAACTEEGSKGECSDV